MIKVQQTDSADWMQRPLFRRDEELTAERLNRIQEYQAARMRHVLLGLAGPGVVHGYEIERDKASRCCVYAGRLHIGCGLAFDRHGRQLYWSGGKIGIGELAGDKPSLDDSASWDHKPCQDCATHAGENPPAGHTPAQTQTNEQAPPGETEVQPGRPYTLWVHYAERRRTGADRCGCDDQEAAWIEEGVVFRLTPCCQLHLPECPVCRRPCDRLQDYICGRLGAVDAAVPADEYLKGLCEEPKRLSARACGDWYFDPDAGIPLACVEVCACGPNDETETDLVFCPSMPRVCAYRPFVYRNPLLFELIQGCHLDLPYVKDLSVGPWVRAGMGTPVQWEVFEEAVTKGFDITFSRPIRTKTLHRASVFVTAVVLEPECEFEDVLRFPVERMEFLDPQGHALPGTPEYAVGVRLRFANVWLEHELKQRRTRSRFEHGAIIELTVRGAMLRDHCDQMLDARPLDYPKGKSGWAMLGDDFVAAFEVEKAKC